MKLALTNKKRLKTRVEHQLIAPTETPTKILLKKHRCTIDPQDSHEEHIFYFNSEVYGFLGIASLACSKFMYLIYNYILYIICIFDICIWKYIV